MKSPETSPKPPARKRYAKPQVRVYGTIKAITRNAGTMGMNADGPGMTSKTS